MFKRIFGVTCFLLSAMTAHGTNEHTIEINSLTSGSMVGGSTIIDTANVLYSKLDDWLIPAAEGHYHFKARAGRFAKWLLLDTPINLELMVINHEVFGHGARVREFGGSPSYDIHLFSGATKFSALFYLLRSDQERSLLHSGGIEANANLAKLIAQKSLRNNQQLDSRAAGLYFWSALDLVQYIASTKEMDANNMSHDMHAYISGLNETYGHTVLTDGELRTKNIVNLLDPFLYFSVRSQFNYISSGKTSWHVPMLEYANYGYLPGMRLNLSPFGPEYQLNNYVRMPTGDMHFIYVRYGHTGNKSYYGVGAEINNIYRYKQFTVNSAIDVWHQPAATVVPLSENKVGGRISLRGEYAFSPLFAFTHEISFKTEGYLPAERLKAGPIWRVGFRTEI